MLTARIVHFCAFFLIQVALAVLACEQSFAADTSAINETQVKRTQKDSLFSLAQTLPTKKYFATEAKKQRAPTSVSIKDFGAIGDCQADDTAALQAARAFLLSNATRYKLLFPSGCYQYSTSPNWAIPYAQIEAEGEVRLRYTGTGNAVIIDGGNALIYGVRMGYFIVEAPNSAINGVYVQSVHHSKLGFNVRGAGYASACMYVAFSVATEFDDFACSANEGGWYLGAKPAIGISLNFRNPGESVSYCLFQNAIIEGVDIGIQLAGTLGNIFIGGTSEGNSSYGVLGLTHSSGDKFFGMDFEANKIADVYSQGKALELHGCDSTNLIAFGSNSTRCSISGGQHTSILFDTGSSFSSVINSQFNRLGFTGTFIDAGKDSYVANLLNVGQKSRYLTGNLSTSATLIPQKSRITFPLTILGAKFGDKAIAAFDSAIGNLVVTANVTETNIVTVTISNTAESATQLNSGAISVSVYRQ